MVISYWLLHIFAEAGELAGRWPYLTGSCTSPRLSCTFPLCAQAQSILKRSIIAHSTSNREKEATIDLLIPVEASNCAQILLRTHARSLFACSVPRRPPRAGSPVSALSSSASLGTSANGFEEGRGRAGAWKSLTSDGP